LGNGKVLGRRLFFGRSFGVFFLSRSLGFIFLDGLGLKIGIFNDELLGAFRAVGINSGSGDGFQIEAVWGFTIGTGHADPVPLGEKVVTIPVHIPLGDQSGGLQKREVRIIRRFGDGFGLLFVGHIGFLKRSHIFQKAVVHIVFGRRFGSILVLGPVDHEPVPATGTTEIDGIIHDQRGIKIFPGTAFFTDDQHDLFPFQGAGLNTGRWSGRI
jgi:hypothetical protein